MTQYPKYEVESTVKFDIVEFISTGKKGNIAKVILFEPTDNPEVYNLAFGDKLETPIKNNDPVAIDDEINSDNGDRDKVLATVASAVFEYTTKYPDRWIIFSGSDKTRTRLYRIAITKNYAELCIDFIIFGVQMIDNSLTTFPFDSKTNFMGFIIKRKT